MRPTHSFGLPNKAFVAAWKGIFPRSKGSTPDQLFLLANFEPIKLPDCLTTNPEIINTIASA